MGSKSSPSGNGSATSEDETGGGVVAPTVSMAALAGVLQENFDSNHIGWNSINWDLIAPIRPNTVPEYSVSHSLESVRVFIPISFANPPEYLQLTDLAGNPVTETIITGTDANGNNTTEEIPVYEVDQFNNPVRIVDSAKDLFLAIGGSDGNDHLRNRDYSFNSDNFGGPRNITGAFMGFSGDDVLYSENLYNPMLMGGSGDDIYILENKSIDGSSIFTQIVERGDDNNDTVISYGNDWAYAFDISGQHLFLADESQQEVVVFWDYYVPDAKIENFWFDFDSDGLNEHYNYNEFTEKLKADEFWLGSLVPEQLGISNLTINDLTQVIAEAVTLSDKIESYRYADHDTALGIARLYQAAFDRTPNTTELNMWVDQWEVEQLSFKEIANALSNSSEFLENYGNLDDTSFINLIYNHVLDRDPDQGGLAFWEKSLENGLDRGEVLSHFSESLENKINTEIQLGGLVESAPGEWLL
ncbi:MAG: DUF4214 domain-containing protein [Porticoccaceae bacterium]|nr:DUF4214 domain-containing protein [Porticoccaceae bacterium]